jgi:hypothetical protein
MQMALCVEQHFAGAEVLMPANDNVLQRFHTEPPPQSEQLEAWSRMASVPLAETPEASSHSGLRTGIATQLSLTHVHWCIKGAHNRHQNDCQVSTALLT